MEKQLNVGQIEQAMASSGISQAALARTLGVSRESVRKWLSGLTFPRPDKLLRLAKTLDLSFQAIVVRNEPAAPVVAFRKARGTKTKDHHIENAQTMGRMLRQLVPFLPFDVLAMPPVLKSPRVDYAYLQKAAGLIREHIRIGPVENLDFHHLIRHFQTLQTVLIPVRWGRKSVHENATHIHLPDSQTTWVYLNLDVNAHDFKFWMAHELGHCLAPELRGDTAEDFADAFAGMLLYPHDLARPAYQILASLPDKTAKLRKIMAIAEECLISPVTVYRQINACAEFMNEEPFDLENDIYRWVTRFNQRYPDFSGVVFGDDLPPEPQRYIQVCTELFDSPFFGVLTAFLKQSGKGAGFVQTVLDVPLLDARGLHEVLT